MEEKMKLEIIKGTIASEFSERLGIENSMIVFTVTAGELFEGLAKFSRDNEAVPNPEKWSTENMVKMWKSAISIMGAAIDRIDPIREMYEESYVFSDHKLDQCEECGHYLLRDDSVDTPCGHKVHPSEINEHIKTCSDGMCRSIKHATMLPVVREDSHLEASFEDAITGD